MANWDRKTFSVLPKKDWLRIFYLFSLKLKTKEKDLAKLELETKEMAILQGFFEKQ